MRHLVALTFSVDPAWIGTFLAVALGVALVVAIIVRVVVAAVRRKPRAIRDGVLRPILGAGAAQSEAYGWKPSTDDDLRPADTPQRD